MRSFWYCLRQCSTLLLFSYLLDPVLIWAEETEIVENEPVVEVPIEVPIEVPKTVEEVTVVEEFKTVETDKGVVYDDALEDGKTITVSGKTYQWIESSRRYVGSAVQKLTGSVDNFLSGDKTIIESESYIRLRLGYIFEEGGHTYPNNNIRLKVDLPKTRYRWSLIFETDPDEFETLEQQQQDNKTREQALQTTDGSIGAIRFILNDWRYWKNDFDVGVKAPLPLNPFVRFNMRRRYQITDFWSANLKHSVYYFDHEGFGEHSTFSLERPLDPDWTFFNVINMQWHDVDQILEFSEVVTFQHILTERDVFLYRTGAFYQDHPVSHLQSYFVDASYRRRLYEHWLYGEVVPSVVWSEVHDFDAIAALTFRVEIIFD